MDALQRFLDEWTNDAPGMKPVFQFLCDTLRANDGVRLEWVGRPGISYSLRARHENQKERPLFVLLDVIDDDPEQRWLSVCFYGDMITDPAGLGDLIPGGLPGSDGYCFDISDRDDRLREYVAARIREAYGNALKS
jgi:hypothetical protein